MIETFYNPTHAPAGAPGSTGGQFARKDGAPNDPRAARAARVRAGKQRVAARVPRTRRGRHFMADSRLNAALWGLDRAKEGGRAADIKRYEAIVAEVREEAWQKAELLAEVRKDRKAALARAIEDVEVAKRTLDNATPEEKAAQQAHLKYFGDRLAFVKEAIAREHAKSFRKDQLVAERMRKAEAQIALAREAAQRIMDAAARKNAGAALPPGAAPGAKWPAIPTMPDYPAQLDHAAEEHRLQAMEVVRTKALDHGEGIVGGKLKVLFADGSTGLFKPAGSERAALARVSKHAAVMTPGFQTEREVGAWEIAKLVGMDHLVSPSAPRILNGQLGVMSRWAPGDEAAGLGNAWDGQDIARAAAFDYVIGNLDRHAGNWVVEGEGGKIHLIDHGFSFPENPPDKPYHPWNWDIVGHVAGVQAGQPRFYPSLNELVKPFVANQHHIVEALHRLKLPQAAIDGVIRRIKKLADAPPGRNLGVLFSRGL